jgi:hypothetical protein
VWTANWCIQKGKKSAASKLSSAGKSIGTMRSQLTIQQQENKKLTELTDRLKAESNKEAECHKWQILERDQKWKQHMDTEIAAFSTCMEQERTNSEATTNQTIQTYKAMNN